LAFVPVGRPLGLSHPEEREGERSARRVYCLTGACPGGLVWWAVWAKVRVVATRVRRACRHAVCSEVPSSDGPRGRDARRGRDRRA
jgi:hypothetical protein